MRVVDVSDMPGAMRAVPACERRYVWRAARWVGHLCPCRPPNLEAPVVAPAPEQPLTSEPPMADAEPLISEPPMAETAPLTSEPTPVAAAAGF